MTGLLTLFAVIATISLLASAAATGAQATGSDPNKRGPWGIASWHAQRSRALNPHERRWQTTLLSGKDNPARWTTAVNEITALERLRDLDPAGPVTEKFNNQWIEASIANLEASIHDSTPPGDTPK